MGWFALHGPIAVAALVDIGRWSGGRRVRFFALVIEAERGDRNCPDFHRDAITASLPRVP
jgi:hypothetical protein